jgi:predicted dehydrogenase
MVQSNTLLEVALVGAGNIAEASHLPALRQYSDQLTVTAVVDVSPGRAGEFAQRWGIPSAYDDLHQMLAEERPDLVVVCTPPGAHRDTVIACLDAGAWVWCEKPPTLSLAEYDAISAHERDGGPYVAYVFQQRFGSGSRALREQIQAKALGRPLVGICHTLWYRDDAYFEVPWRGRWETEGGGPTMGHGIHQMDLMLSILGDWDEVRAMTGTLDRRIETEDVSLAMVRFASGALGSVVNSLLSPREESYLRFDFARATVELRHLYGYQNADWTYTPAHAGPPDDVPSSHIAQYAPLLDAVERGERPSASGAEGRQTLEFVTGLYASAHTGRAVLRSELTRDFPYYRRLNGMDSEGPNVPGSRS